MNNWAYEILFGLTVLYYIPEAYLHYKLFHVQKFNDVGGRAHWAFGLTTAVTNILMSVPAIIIIGLNGWQIILLGCMYAITRAVFHDGFYNMFRGNKFFYTGTDQSAKFGYDFDHIWITLERAGIGVGKTKIFILLIITIIYKTI